MTVSYVRYLERYLAEREQQNLPMDRTSRMKRAKEQGFRTKLYHGTAKEFRSFLPYSHFGTNLSQAKARAIGGKLHTVLVRGRFLRVPDACKHKWDTDYLEAIKAQGYDGVVYLNRYEGIPYEETKKIPLDRGLVSDKEFKALCPSAKDSYIVFDPKNVRSIEAAFDPNKSNSDDIYA